MDAIQKQNWSGEEGTPIKSCLLALGFSERGSENKLRK